MKKPASFSVLPLALLAAALLGGCATASKPEAMAITATAVAKSQPYTVSVAVSGGSETSSAGASKISSEDFAKALEASIKNTGLFKGLAVPGDYHLEVYIARLDQPVFGLSMTVTLETNWTLSRSSDKKVVWKKVIPTVYTAKVGDAFAGSARLRLANEGAARANIKDALSEIAALDLR
jgi:hypothetical protein